MDGESLLDLIFGDADDCRVKVNLCMPDGATECDLFRNICCLYVDGCRRCNGLSDTHSFVARLMERRLGIKPIVVNDASPVMPFLAPVLIVTQVFMGALPASRLVLQRHGTPDTLFEVRFEIRTNTAGTFLENMCGMPLLPRHMF